MRNNRILGWLDGGFKNDGLVWVEYAVISVYSEDEEDVYTDVDDKVDLSLIHI